MSVCSTFCVLFVPTVPVSSDVHPALNTLWTVCQVSAFQPDHAHMVFYHWCKSLKSKNLMGKEIESGRNFISGFTHKFLDKKTEVQA